MLYDNFKGLYLFVIIIRSVANKGKLIKPIMGFDIFF